MKVTVHLEMTDSQWGHVIDRAANMGVTAEQYIAGAALGYIDDGIFDDQVYA